MAWKFYDTNGNLKTAGSAGGGAAVAYENEVNIFTELNEFKDIEFTDQDATPVADRRLRNIDGLIRAVTTGQVEGRYLSNDSLELMVGADGSNAGQAGAVPAPAATDNTKFLKGDGTWAIPAGGGSSIPAGTVLPYAGSAAPTDWLLADGSAVSRTTYSDLFALIGTTFGAGDGSTTFNLPDLRGRVPLGKDNMGGSSANRVTATQADNLGQGSGAETHTLATSEIPSHTHAVPTAAAGNAGGGAVNTGDQAVNSSRSTYATGGGGAHNNMQPYLTLNYIIKT